MGKKEGTTDYILRGIPSDFWKQVRAKALIEGRQLKDIIIEGLKDFLAEKAGAKKKG